ncbi:MAG: ISNCY family transposase [Coriobacteriales bacterium]|nr:ISNCY family transposase [Coriobacteriales bacterium]
MRTIDAARAGRIANSEGARQLGLSKRQFIRLRKRVAEEGPSGVIHKGRGRRSNRRICDEERARIARLLEKTYTGFNDTHATEMLAERHGVTACRETIRSIRVEAGLPAARKRRAPKHRSRRERRGREGTMLLLDGSMHRWFEKRGKKCTLLGAIDDATGQIVALRFEPTEDLAGYLEPFATILEERGVPASTYTDKHSVFHVNRATPSIEEQLSGTEPLSQFGRALDELGIVRIYSLSPQARGRVERLWGTLQDRLVSEMRLEGIDCIEEANAFLERFVPRYNARFAREASEPVPDWLPAPNDVDWFLCAKYARAVANDNTVRLGELVIDVPPAAHRATFARARVEVHELRDGRVRIVHQGRVIAEKPAPTGFERLKPRLSKALGEPGQLPVASLADRRCPVCNHHREPIAATG